jgi:hypothetical protein
MWPMGLLFRLPFKFGQYNNYIYISAYDPNEMSTKGISVLKTHVVLIQFKLFFKYILFGFPGEHESCGQWCRAHEDGYKPKQLPYGKPLTNANLKQALTDLMGMYATKAESLSTVGSSQANESFNQMVSCKAPKRM